MINPNELHDYQVRFLDAEGLLMEDVPLLVESLAVAKNYAEAMATEIGATNYFITSKPDKDSRG